MTRSHDPEPVSETTDPRNAPDGRDPREESTPRREAPAEVPPMPRKRTLAVPLLVLAGLLAYGGYRHWETSNEAAQTQQEAIDFVPEVQTITAKTDDSPTKLTLPGQTEPFDTAMIWPRATGYIAERRVDIGSRVKKGDLLVRIAAPDLDQQLAQARGQLAQAQAAQAQSQASLDQAKANLALANVTYNRTNKLTERGYETVQNNDNQRTQVQSQEAAVETAQAGIKVAAANVQAQQATVDRLVALTAFEKVVAPFDGVVTTRGVDVGDLVNADTKTGTALFTVASDKVLRVTVHVPQANAFAIHDGLVGDVTLPQQPGKLFSGKIARTSVSLLDSSRVLDTEVDVQNRDGALKPGAFVNVTFNIPRLHPDVVLPAEALIFNKDGLQVASVQDDEIHMMPIKINRDFGKTVELREGLGGGETIVVNAPPDLAEHSKVKVRQKPAEEQARK